MAAAGSVVRAEAPVGDRTLSHGSGMAERPHLSGRVRCPDIIALPLRGGRSQRDRENVIPARAAGRRTERRGTALRSWPGRVAAPRKLGSTVRPSFGPSPVRVIFRIEVTVPASQTRAERLADEIASAILAGALAPGLHLDEQVLAQRFGVSRTPVRDALRLLSGTGLIDLRPRTGATVRTITPDERDMLFVAMGEVEATCARLATLSMTPAERAGLQNLHDTMGRLAEAGDRDGYTHANQAFHALLYAGGHNSVVEEIALSLRRRLTPFRRAQFRAPGRLHRSHAEHAAVVRAVLARDAAAANAAMLIHMSIVEDAFESLDASPSQDRSVDAREPARRPVGGARAAARPLRRERQRR